MSKGDNCPLLASLCCIWLISPECRVEPRTAKVLGMHFDQRLLVQTLHFFFCCGSYLDEEWPSQIETNLYVMIDISPDISISREFQCIGCMTHISVPCFAHQPGQGVRHV